MESHKKLIIITFVTACLAMPVYAQTADTGATDMETSSSGEFQWVLSLGLTVGGDDFAEVNYYDDDDDYLYSDDLEAGGLIYLGGGGNYRFADSPFSLQGVLAYHFDSVDADNGDASFDRWVFDLTGFYNIGSHRIGLGLTRHFNVEVDIDSDQGDFKADFDDATGFLVEYNYLFTKNVGIGIRYTHIDYDYSDLNVDSVDGSHGGLFINGFF